MSVLGGVLGMHARPAEDSKWRNGEMRRVWAAPDAIRGTHIWDRKRFQHRRRIVGGRGGTGPRTGCI